MVERTPPAKGDWDGLPASKAHNFWLRSPNWQILKTKNGKNVQLVWQLLPSILSEDLEDQSLNQLGAGLRYNSAYKALLANLPSAKDAAHIWQIGRPEKTKPLLSPTAYGLCHPDDTQGAAGHYAFYYNVPDTPVELGLKIDSAADAAQYLTSICTALSRLHNAGVNHLGIAEDVMLRMGGEYWVAGLMPDMRILSQFEGLNHQKLLPQHAPPELWDRNSNVAVGPWTDIYMAAALAIQAYCKTPFPTIAERIASADPQGDIRAMLGKAQSADPITAKLARALVKAVALKIDDRPQSVAQWRTDFGYKNPMAAPTKMAAPAKPVAAKSKTSQAKTARAKTARAAQKPATNNAPRERVAPKNPARKKRSGFAFVRIFAAITAFVAIAGIGFVIYSNSVKTQLAPAQTETASNGAEQMAIEPALPEPPPVDPILEKLKAPIYLDDGNGRLTDISDFMTKFRLVEDDGCSYPLTISFSAPLEDYSKYDGEKEIIVSFPDGWTWTTRLERGISQNVVRDRAAWDDMQYQQQYSLSVRGVNIKDENGDISANGEAYNNKIARIAYVRDSGELLISSADDEGQSIDRGPYVICE